VSDDLALLLSRFDELDVVDLQENLVLRRSLVRSFDPAKCFFVQSFGKSGKKRYLEGF